MESVSSVLHALLKGRRSIRRYHSQPVPTEVLDRILDAATWAPSAHNRQPWRFVVLTEADDRVRLALRMGDLLRRARSADGDDAEDIEADASRSYRRITGAPVAVLVFLTMEDMDRYPDAHRGRAEELMAVQGVAMATQNILLAAHAEGLGACWMCAPLFCQPEVAEAVGAPAHWQAQALITMGYADSKGKPGSRRPVSEIVLQSGS